MSLQNWTSTDWTFTGLILDVLGAFILVRGLLFNPFRREEAGTYYGFNPFLMRGDLGRKLDTIIGFLLLILGFVFQGIGSLINFFRGTADSAIFNSACSLGIFFLLILTILIAALLVPPKIALSRYRKENANARLIRIQEKVVEVQSGTTKAHIREEIDQTEKLFQIKQQGADDLERLKNIERYLSKWSPKI